ncbi:uncharacterized protein LOC123722546 [Papilio machaon]|uniref:uncharacterized protein LOC123722546 n=1 Tax=Papilio machaon TaxID=76193 RepID=UPI001E6649F3|nr:uncharacterized protein LOC123722546 [Papilio machaon]
MDLWLIMLSALAAVIVAAFSAALGTAVEHFKEEEYNSSEVVDNLRRQLMKDNYDYMLEASAARPYRYHAESDDGEPPTEVVRPSTTSTLETPVDFYTKVTRRDVTRTTADLRDLRRNPMYDQRSKYVAPSERRKLATAGGDVILYDDDKARRQNDRFISKDPATTDDHSALVDHSTLSYEIGESRRREGASDTTVKYSLLKVAAARRSGRRPHLVKEEKPGEVSIVNLGEDAVPQFRLPRPRAQYMRDSDPESDREAPRESRARLEPPSAVDLDR